MQRILLVLLTIWLSLSCVAKNEERTKLLLERISRFSSSIRADIPDSLESNNYTKYRIDFIRRNPTILSIPHIIHLIRRKERNHLMEMYSHVVFYKNNEVKSHRNIYVSTVRKRREALDVISDYLVPDIYRSTVFDDQLFSPVVKANKIYYIYHNRSIGDGLIRIDFKPRVNNTMLGKGHVIMERATGRIISYDIKGEYDMTSYRIRVKMDSDSVRCLFPKECAADMKISYLGNIIKVGAKVHYNLPVTLPDSIVNVNNRAMLNQLRPEPLDSQENKILKDYVADVRLKYSLPDSISEDSILQIGAYLNKEKSGFKHVLWDVFGDNMLNHIKGHFGKEDRGSFKLGPLFNPGYFGYSESKGIVYKLKLRANYTFSENSDISIRAKYGYAFKLHRPYFTVPITYTFNKKKHGNIKLELRTGKRITNSQVLEEVKKEHNTDSIDFNKMNLDYFKNINVRLLANYDISEKYGLQGGFIFYDRKAENAKHFREMGKPVNYDSFASFVQFQYRPRGYKGPFLLLDYEHGFKHVLDSDSEHRRWEFDTYHTFSLSRLRNWFVRGGMGCYTHRGKNLYFLDYENFRRNDVPEGWDDDWSGEFELLDSHWYNAADYYFRAHTTYESPLLLLSWIPVVGQVLEKERLYISALAIRRLAPYVECGYGFTNRVFSMGVFASFSNNGYERLGFKFGFELFNKWR